MNIIRLKRTWILALFSIVVIVLVACGDSSTATPLPSSTPLPTSTPVPTGPPAQTPAPEPTNATAATSNVFGSGELTAEEAEYVEQVRAGWNEFNSKAMEFRAVFGQTYSQRYRFFQAL